MALIDKDQLKAEIERLVKLNKECAKGGGDRVFLEGIAAGYADVISFLNTIPEQPVEGLEEELENYAKLYPLEDAGSYRNLITLARHFAEWQKVQDQKTIELAEDHAMLAGMNKMEQQMMEDAVEYYVVGEIAGHPVGPAIVHYDESLNIGDKVKVIVIKED